MEADFKILCLPEGITFAVERARLIEGSDVFSDMFSCCDDNAKEEKGWPTIDIYESSNDVSILVRLLHNPPPELPKEKSQAKSPGMNARTSPAAIPYMLLPRLFAFAEKYAFKPSIMKVLHSHLAAQASTAPLLVYGLASQYSLSDIADRASKFLVSTPLEKYSIEDIKVIPSAEAYHKLLQLQTYRKRKIIELLSNEELFPHGYGACTVHRSYAESMWDEKRKRIMLGMDSGTDVAAKMSRGLNTAVRNCKVCLKAWIAATDMLAYRCHRVARRISEVPM